MTTKARVARLRSLIRRLESWRCSECGCDLDAANRKRRRLGLAEVAPRFKTCSPSCTAARRARYFRERARRTPAIHVPEPRQGRGWHCSECGIDLPAANRRRQRLGLRPIGAAFKTCSPKCSTTRDRRRWLARFGRGRRGPGRDRR